MTQQFSPDMKGLFALVAHLRGTDGCPWDRSQNATSMVGHFLDEAYELVEAVAAEDLPNIQEELGDVLFLLVFVASFYIEKGYFEFAQVISQVLAKMVHRHPHVFDSAALETPEQVSRQWQKIKSLEKRTSPKGAVSKPDAPAQLPSHLPQSPSLRRAMHLKTAGGLEDTLARVRQSLDCLDQMVSSGSVVEAHRHVGQALLNLARTAKKLQVCPETALRTAIAEDV